MANATFFCIVKSESGANLSYNFFRVEKAELAFELETKNELKNRFALNNYVNEE